MSPVPEWSTACVDWESRIVEGRSLIPFPPLFPEEAEAALKIFRDLKIVDAAGSPTMEQACRQWVFDFVGSIFGAYDVETGRRLIRYFMLLVSKKNSKSTIAAGIMLTALMRNWRESGEFYILAPTKEVANNSFFPARDMIGADDGLSALLHVQEGIRTITHRNTGAFLKVVAADTETVSGKKTIGLFVDELWLFGKRANAASMIREASGGLASRPEGFIVYATTQSNSKPAGVFEQRLADFRNIRDGKLIDPRSLGMLYEFPPAMLASKGYEKRENWPITNPNMGASVDEEYLLDEHAKAARAGRADLIDFFAKHLNVEIGQGLRTDGWAGALVWERGLDPTLTLDTLLERSEVVTVGIDGGGHDDLLGIAVLGREKGTKRWLGWVHAFISDIGIERRKANLEDYTKFIKDGDLTQFEFREAPALELNADETPKIITLPLPDDIQYVVDLVKRIQEMGKLAQVGVDAAGIGGIVDALADIGITQDAETLDSVRQGIALMGSFKTIERKLSDRSFLHGGQPLLGWCVGNAQVVATPTAQRIARDEAGYGKVDPLMALFNAGHLMSLNPTAGGRSIFENAAWWDTPKPSAKDSKNVAVPAQG